MTAYEIDGGTVRLELVGPDEPAPAGALAADLETAWGIPVDLTVVWTPAQRDRATAP